jgi:hypothetical protein
MKSAVDGTSKFASHHWVCHNAAMKNGKLILVLALGGAGLMGLVLIVSCAGLLLVGFRSAAAANGEISTAVDDLMRAAASGNFAQTYQSATTPEFRQKTSAAEYTKVGDLIKTQLGALQSKQVLRVNMRQINANSFTDVSYQGTFERGAATINATLKRSGSRWLFVALHINSPAFQNDLPDQTCPKCSCKYAKSARFCPHCGAALQAEEQATSVEKQSSATSPR